MHRPVISLLLCLAVLSEMSVSAQTWTELQTGIEEDLFGIAFLNSDTGVVTGGTAEYGKIFRTRNGGNDWEDVTPAGTELLYDVKPFGNNGFMAVGLNGVIWRSEDAGETWSLIPSGTQAWLSALWLGEDGKGFACGTSGTLLQTSNAGLTWTPVTSNTGSWLLSIHFFNSSLGYATGASGQVIRTTDGGETWVPIVTPGNANINAIWAFDQHLVFAVLSNGILMKSENQGVSWESVLIHPYAEALRTIVFYGNYGIIAGRKFTFFTANGGLNWANSHSMPKQEWMSATVSPDRTLFLAGRNGKILRSEFHVSVHEQELETTLPYPNPARSEVFIQGNPGFHQAELWDAQGRLIMSRNLEPGLQRFSVEKLSPGLYFIVYKGYKSKTHALWVQP